MFITGILGVGGGLLSFGQFGGIGGNRPFGGFGGLGGLGGLGGFGSGFGGHNQHGVLGDGISGGYYKSSPVSFKDFTTTEKEPQYTDQFYNYEKNLLRNKSDKPTVAEKEPKDPHDRTARANSYRSFVWQAS